MKILNARLLACSLALTTPVAWADILTIPVGQQHSSAVSNELPRRGLSAASVIQRHGEPAVRHPAIGEPPISRWDYQGFSVYFEASTVVHSVHQHRPRAN
ncbi:phosphodiesterase [Pseudomonas sp. OIL-1]|uniref:phosphodiesterase n=1 Tax=Pseudomonas sp. OIL-1 TaxID=2706126 RepID=UPI00273F2D3F|nr:phosphodiesterase [Pseudomonas sp. OIL-1]